MPKIDRSKGARHHAKRVLKKKKKNKSHNPRLKVKKKKR